jgi:transcription initiation factor TFIID subunit 5
MAVSPDGRTLASAGKAYSSILGISLTSTGLDSSIWLWDLGSSRPIKRMTGHKGPIQSLSFSAESSILVSGGMDCTVRCWDVKSSGGEKTRGEGEGGLKLDLGGEKGSLPMDGGDMSRDDGNSTSVPPFMFRCVLIIPRSDLLSTFYTKRTPIIKTHYTPRNLCMVAGTFNPPSNAKSA